MVKIKGIHKEYGTQVVLSDISFSLEKGQKVALVGHNGTGKSTLLKILAGETKPDTGDIHYNHHTCIGYFPQEHNVETDETVEMYLRQVTGFGRLEQEVNDLVGQLSDRSKLQRYNEVYENFEHLGGYSFLSKMMIILSGFGFTEKDRQRSIKTLSGGQRSKVALTGILLKGVDMLLLDEPTNNLDMPALIWLEDFIADSDTACMIVSHDRVFLDRVVSRIFEIDWHTHSLNTTRGGYTNYLSTKKKEVNRQKEEYRHQQEERERLQKTADQKKGAATKGARFQGSDNDKMVRGFKRDKAARSAKSAKSIEKRLEQMDQIDKPIERKEFAIPLKAKTHPRTCDISLKDVVLSYSSGFTLGPVSLSISFGERIAILGLNGSGKTTLLKIIAQELTPKSGLVSIGSSAVIGNLMQQHENLPPKEGLYEFLEKRTDYEKEQIYALLVKFDFSTQGFSKTIGQLSPGERARLLLALFSALSVNVLILDEPTNHLDVEALDALDAVLEHYTGTIVLVSHDRFLLDRLKIDRMYELSDGSLHQISGLAEYVVSIQQNTKRLLHLLKSEKV